MTEQILVQLIDAAFGNLPCPAEHAIGAHERGYCLETDQIVDFFSSKHWRVISATALWNDYVGDGSACLCFMSPEAFRFYLPTYMMIAIREYQDSDLMADSAINALLPSASAHSWWEKRVSVLTKQQREAAVAFLHYMQEHHADDYRVHGPTDALKYWKEDGEQIAEPYK